jgi:hypothetical protein
MTSQTLPPLPLPFQLSRLATSYWVPQAIHAAAALGAPMCWLPDLGPAPRSPS